VIDLLDRTFNYDRLYIGGGNAAQIKLQVAEGCAHH